MPDVILRRAKMSDAPAIAALAAQLGYPSESECVRRRIEAIDRSEEHFLILAESDGSPAGFLHARASHALDSGFRVEIMALVVGEGCRREGIGRRLVERMETWARELGAEVIVVRSNTKRIESHRFYPSLGFREVKTQFVYQKQLTDSEDS